MDNSLAGLVLFLFKQNAYLMNIMYQHFELLLNDTKIY